MDILIYIILGIITSIYAFFLNTNSGRKLAADHTWITVVIGTLIVLVASSFLIPLDSLFKVFIAFGVGGLPMIIRSLYNKAKQ